MEDLIFSVLGQSSNFMSDAIKLKSDVKELQERLIERTKTFLFRDAEQTRKIRDLERLAEYLENESDALFEQLLIEKIKNERKKRIGR